MARYVAANRAGSACAAPLCTSDCRGAALHEASVTTAHTPTIAAAKPRPEIPHTPTISSLRDQYHRRSRLIGASGYIINDDDDSLNYTESCGFGRSARRSRVQRR